MKTAMGSLLIEDLVTQKLMQWILPSPAEVATQVGGDEKSVNLFYLMYALVFPQRRRDTSPMARHAFDAAIRDHVRDLGYGLTPVERQVVMAHDIPEDVGRDFATAHVISDVMAAFLTDEAFATYLNLVTDYHALIWKPIKKQLSALTQESMTHALAPDIAVLVKERLEAVMMPQQVDEAYRAVSRKIAQFKKGLLLLYDAFGSQKPSILKVKDLRQDELSYIVEILDRFIACVDLRGKASNRLGIKELNRRYKRFHLEILDVLERFSGSYPGSVSGYMAIRTDRRFVLYGENPLVIALGQSLYQIYIRRIVDFVGGKSGAFDITPLMAKLADAIDNVRTLPRDNIASMRNIYQKAGCIIEQAQALIADLENAGSNTQRLRLAVAHLFQNLDAKCRAYEKGIGDATSMDTSYIGSLRLITSMLDQNEELKKAIIADAHGVEILEARSAE